LYGNGRILNTRLRNAMGQSDMHVKRHRIGLAVSKHSRRLKCAERASVRHTDAVSGVVQRDATIHQSIAAKVASGFELGNSLDQKRVTATDRTTESNSASCLTGWTELQIRRKVLVLKKKKPTTNQCDGLFFFQVGATGFEPPTEFPGHHT